MKLKTTPKIMTLFIYLVIVIFFLELLLRLSIMNLVLDFNLLRIFLFSIAYAFFTLFLVKFFHGKLTKIIILTFVIVLSIIYFAQDMYFRIFNSFFSFAISGDAVMGITFIGRFIKKITFIHILYLVPIASSIYLVNINHQWKNLIQKIQYKKVYQPILILAFAFTAMVLSRITIPKNSIIDINSEYNYSDYDLYQDPYSPYLAIKKFGLFTYIRIDLESNLDNKVDQVTTEQEIIDFLNTLPDHDVNDYTNYFEGKNLILIMAESFDTYAIDPSLTPNIYSMLDHSWYFENYYSPLYYRNTADTEFMVQTSFLPHNGVELSMEAFQDNEFDYTIPRVFEAVGYDTISFHDYTDYFYPRSVFHPVTLGYGRYFDAVSMSLIQEEQSSLISNHVWPSDNDMMSFVTETLNGDDPFFTYILTVSGHLPYDSSHAIATQNIDTTRQIFMDEGRELPPDESILYYHAAQYEFDKAMGTLIQNLSDQGQLEDTVIMVYGDHYAYGLDQEDIWAYDTVKEPYSTLDIHNVPFFIYNPTLEKTVISNTISSIDLMPTISNLFGLPLDYQQVFGQDGLDDVSNVVQLSNGSIITDDFTYNIETDEYVFKNPEYTLEDAYILCNYMIHRKQINNLILQSNFFYEINHPDQIMEQAMIIPKSENDEFH